MQVEQISNSQIDKFEECPLKWLHHYVDRIRSIYKPSSLFFGSAMDEAFGRILLEKMPQEKYTDADKELLKKDYKQLYHDELLKQKHNGEIVNLKYSSITSYFKSDFELQLLTPEDRKEVVECADENDIEITDADIEAFLAECHELKKKGVLSGGELIVYNLIGWLSLYRKGLILIEAWKEEIYNQIDTVISIQKKVELDNGSGTIYIGYIDYECTFIDEPDVVYVMDNKTSSRKYADDSVVESTQLASYCEFVKTNKAGYSVVEKKLRKRDPIYRTQLIRDEIPEETFEKTFDRIENMLDNVEDENFWRACDQEGGDKNCNFHGRRCEYWNLCHGNGELIGLVDMNELEKENK